MYDKLSVGFFCVFFLQFLAHLYRCTGRGIALPRALVLVTGGGSSVSQMLKF